MIKYISKTEIIFKIDLNLCCLRVKTTPQKSFFCCIPLPFRNRKRSNFLFFKSDQANIHKLWPALLFVKATKQTYTVYGLHYFLAVMKLCIVSCTQIVLQQNGKTIVIFSLSQFPMKMDLHTMTKKTQQNLIYLTTLVVLIQSLLKGSFSLCFKLYASLSPGSSRRSLSLIHLD